MTFPERSGGLPQPTIEEIKVDLKGRCDRVPSRWDRFFPIPLDSYQTSPLLPPDRARLYADEQGHLLPVPHVVGHSEIVTFLERNGIVVEKLLPFQSDGYDLERAEPDLILGETSDERYREAYEDANRKLARLERRVLRGYFF